MRLIHTVSRLGLNQIRNAMRAVSGRPVVLSSLASMTLDEDDVDLARFWLRVQQQWRDAEVTASYEAEFSRWNRSRYAFAFMTGREALSACIYALKLEPGDEAILPGYTCVVVPNAFHYAGVQTIYSDIELDTYGLDVAQIENKITAKTRAILLQHLYGLVCRDYDQILDLAHRRGLKVIEDCAHATGAEYQGLKVGTRGDIAFYSSERSKVFNTVLGGIAVTSDPCLAERLREYYEQACYPDDDAINKQLHNVILDYYQFKHPQRWWLGDIAEVRHGNKRIDSTTKEEEQGIRPSHYGRKIPAPISALALNQLKKIDRYNEQRRQTAKRWARWSEENGYKRPLVLAKSTPVYLRYPILVEPEKKLDTSWATEELGISIGRWFISHLHPAARKVEGCPNADKAVSSCINFPTLIAP